MLRNALLTHCLQNYLGDVLHSALPASTIANSEADRTMVHDVSAAASSRAVIAIIAGATAVALAAIIAIAAVTIMALGHTQGTDASATVRDVLPVFAAFGGAALAVVAVALGALIARSR